MNDKQWILFCRWMNGMMFICANGEDFAVSHIKDLMKDIQEEYEDKDGNFKLPEDVKK